MGYKHTIDVPEYIEKMGLNAFEYQCGRGVRIKEELAKKFGALAAEKDIQLSLHAPYYISLSSLEEEKRLNSVNYILQSAKAVAAMGGERIVVHSGSCSKMSRTDALELAKQTMRLAIEELDNNGLSQVRICPETMGKVNQLGTLEEVLELCKLDERMLPCIDFGHIYARTLGGLKKFEDFEDIFQQIENALGISRLREFHSHFSRIEYSVPGGEKRHLTFEDKNYGPDFTPVAELILKYNCSPTIICESAGTQAEDAKTMLDIYNYKREETK